VWVTSEELRGLYRPLPAPILADIIEAPPRGPSTPAPGPKSTALPVGNRGPRAVGRTVGVRVAGRVCGCCARRPRHRFPANRTRGRSGSSASAVTSPRRSSACCRSATSTRSRRTRGPRGVRVVEVLAEGSRGQVLPNAWLVEEGVRPTPEAARVVRQQLAALHPLDGLKKVLANCRSDRLGRGAGDGVVRSAQRGCWPDRVGYQLYVLYLCVSRGRAHLQPFPLSASPSKKDICHRRILLFRCDVYVCIL
jgi:hypothetical protein